VFYTGWGSTETAPTSTGTIFSSTPGNGSPIRPTRSVSQ